MNGILAYAMFYIGDMASRLDWITGGRLTGRLYQWAMLKSSAHQDKAGWGPWKDVRP